MRALVVIFAIALAACAAELPGVIRDEMAKTASEGGAKKQATLVFFTDFQCPYCRATHAALAPVLDARRGRVRVVTRHVPLHRHPDAKTAARAAVCVERIAKALTEDYTHALYLAPDLSEGACEAMAVERGVDPDRLRTCLADAATDVRIEQDIAMFEAVRGDGVPLLYVDGKRLDGAQSSRELATALDDALGR